MARPPLWAVCGRRRTGVAACRLPRRDTLALSPTRVGPCSGTPSLRVGSVLRAVVHGPGRRHPRGTESEVTLERRNPPGGIAQARDRSRERCRRRRHLRAERLLRGSSGRGAAPRGLLPALLHRQAVDTDVVADIDYFRFPVRRGHRKEPDSRSHSVICPRTTTSSSTAVERSLAPAPSKSARRPAGR